MSDRQNPLQVGTLAYSKVGLVMLCLWLYLGDFAMMLRERAVTPTIIEVLGQHAVAPATIILLKDVVPSVLSFLVIIPLCYLSDRHRGRRGRRIPFLMGATPLAVAGLLLLAYTPELGDSLHACLGSLSPGAAWCFVGVFAVAWMLFEVGSMMTMTLFPALVNDVVPPAVLGRFYGILRVVSLVSGILFMYGLIAWTKTHAREILFGLGLVFGVAFSVMCFQVKEGSYPAPEPIAPDGRDGLWGHIRHFLVDSFSSPSNWCVLVLMVFTTLCLVPFNAVSQLYSNSLGISLETYGRVTAWAWCVSMVIALGVGWMVDRWGVLVVSAVTIAAFAIAAFVGYILMGDGGNFLLVYALHTVFCGAFLTAVNSLPMKLYPRLKFSQFASAVGIVGIPVNILYNLLSAWLLHVTNNNYRNALLFTACFAFVGFILVLVVWRHQRPSSMPACANPVA